jgi:hypothetical protein
VMGADANSPRTLAIPAACTENPQDRWRSVAVAR